MSVEVDELVVGHGIAVEALDVISAAGVQPSALMVGQTLAVDLGGAGGSAA